MFIHKTTLLAGYGMTEVSMASHFPVFNEHNYASVGKLLPNLEVEVGNAFTVIHLM